MLCQLSIQNIALIDALNLEFTEGLNVLTGETGAGKSIVIDAMNLALGERADRDLIRAGQDRTRADLAFHAAIVRATHNEFMMRLLPTISQAVETAIADGGHREALAQVTLQDHALLMNFFRRRDEAGAEHAMAIHMLHAMEEMGLE